MHARLTLPETLPRYQKVKWKGKSPPPSEDLSFEVMRVCNHVLQTLLLMWPASVLLYINRSYSHWYFGAPELIQCAAKLRRSTARTSLVSRRLPSGHAGCQRLYPLQELVGAISRQAVVPTLLLRSE